MTTTPAVGVGAGRIGGGSFSPRRDWGSAFRSALLFAALFAASTTWLAVAALPAAAVTNSLRVRASYDVHASINWSAASIDVTSTAHVTNTSGKTVSELAFNLITLKIGRLQGLVATAGGAKVTPTVSGQTVIVPIANGLPPRGELDVAISYRAFFNSDTGGKKALFMKKNRTIAAYRWIPWLSRVQKWKTPNFGESWVTATSPRVTVTLSSDVPLVIATSGRRVAAKGNSQTFTATYVRDFNFAASPNYAVRTVRWNGIKVRFYYRNTSVDRLQQWTLAAMKRFTKKLGPYPYSTFNVAETPAGVGMESPGMIWVDATLSRSRFPYIVVHETAHQWFYSTIGNNQALEPFVDEALSDYLTRDLLSSFRKSRCATDRLDKTVYSYSAKCYPEVIYVQGGSYLRMYEKEVGSNAFWGGLSTFYGEKKFRIVGTRGLLDHLDAATGYDSSRHATRFPSRYP